MNTITIIGIGITILWLSALAYYFYVSRQQNELEGEIDDLKAKLEAAETKQDQQQAE